MIKAAPIVLVLSMICSVLSLWLPATPAMALDTDLGAMRKAIFKVRVISQDPDYRKPWSQKAMISSSGTGFYIGTAGIMTNAHVVAGGKFISVLKDGDDRAVSARVKYIAHDCDLALLEVEDQDYFKGVQPLALGDIPEVRQSVYTIGFPSGGEQLSITQGVVSRISYRRYVHSGSDSHMLIQVDSAINPGNSGGPVVQGKAVVGVAFQTQTSAENTGYIIPVPVVERFLRDIDDGRYDGHPVQEFWVMEDSLENAAAREYHGLQAGEGGVKVADVAPYSPLYEKIVPGDILLDIDGKSIGVDGKIPLYGERLSFRAYYDLKQINDQIKFTVLRKGIRLPIAITLQAKGDFYQAAEAYEMHPRFFVFAGHVFSSLSRSFLKSWGRNFTIDSPLLLRYLHFFISNEPLFRTKRDVIVLSNRLPHAVNAFAGPYIDEVLVGLDGQPVASLEDLAMQIGNAPGPFLRFDFWNQPVPYVIDLAAARRADSSILSLYKVPLKQWFGNSAMDGATANWEGEIR